MVLYDALVVSAAESCSAHLLPLYCIVQRMTLVGEFFRMWSIDSLYYLMYFL